MSLKSDAYADLEELFVILGEGNRLRSYGNSPRLCPYDTVLLEIPYIWELRGRATHLSIFGPLIAVTQRWRMTASLLVPKLKADGWRAAKLRLLSERRRSSR